MAGKKALTQMDLQKQAVSTAGNAHKERFGRACMADGGIAGLAGKRERVIEEATNPKKPVAAAAPVSAPEPTEQEKARSVGIIIPDQPAPAPAPKKGFVDRVKAVFGFADGGLLGADTLRQTGLFTAGLNQSIANRTGIATGGLAPQMDPVQPATPAPTLGQPTMPSASAASAAPAAAPRQSSSGWNYQNGRIAMADGGGVCANCGGRHARGAKCMNNGGKVRGPGGPIEDKVPAMLSAGEYVLPADTVKAIGVEKLDQLKAATHTPAAAQRARFGAATPDSVDGMGLADGTDGTVEDEFAKRRARLARPVGLETPYQEQARLGKPLTMEAPPPAAAPAQPAPASAPQPAPPRPTGPIEARFTPNADGTMRPEQARFQEAQMRSAAPAIMEEATGGAAKAAAPAAEAGGKSLLGRAAGAVTAPFRAAAGVFGAASRVAGPIGTAAMALQSSDVGAGSDVLRNPNTGVITNASSAPTLTPQAQAMSSGDRQRLLNIINDPKADPYQIAQAKQQLIGDGSKQTFGSPADKYAAQPQATPQEAATKPAATAAPNTGDPTTDATNAAMAADAARDAALVRAGVPRTALGQPAVPDNMRGEIVRNARPDQGAAVNLGDYGSDGTKIFGSASKPGGRIDTFSGAGGGSEKATGYAPRGVDFGITPEAMAKYQAEKEMRRVVGDAPTYQAPGMSKEHQAAIANVENLTKQLGRATSRPERNQINEQINAAKAVLAAHQDTYGQNQQAATHAFGTAANAYNTRLNAYSQTQASNAAAYNAAGQRQFEWQKYLLERGDKATDRQTTAANTAYSHNRDNLGDLQKVAGTVIGGMNNIADDKKKALSDRMNTYLSLRTQNGKKLSQLASADQVDMVGEAAAHAIITDALGDRAPWASAGPSPTFGKPYDAKGTTSGPELTAYLQQKNFSLADMFKNGVNVGGAVVPWNRFPREAQEYLEKNMGQK